MPLPRTSRSFIIPRTDIVTYGIDALDGLDTMAARVGATRVVVVRPAFLKDSDIDGRLSAILGDALATIVDSVPQHVPLGHVLALATDLRDLGADCVVSLGGGTAIDAVKAGILCMSFGVTDASQFTALAASPDLANLRSKVPHIAVPTTLSGAEHTALVGVTIEETHEKIVLNVPALAPDAVILDPVITTRTPAALWTSSGIRAVDHAVEGMLSARRMPFMDALASHALRLLTTCLPRSAKDPDDLDARLECMIGTWLSIFALPNVGVGLSHGIGHQLAAEFDMLHGVTSAVMLPRVMEFGAAYTRPQLRAIAEAMGTDTRSLTDEEASDRAVAAVRELISAAGVPSRLSVLGVEADRLANVATNAMRDKSIAASPRPVSREDLLALLHSAW